MNQDQERRAAELHVQVAVHVQPVGELHQRTVIELRNPVPEGPSVDFMRSTARESLIIFPTTAVRSI